MARAVQAAIRTMLYQNEALERGDFKAALGAGLVADAENRRGFHLVNAARKGVKTPSTLSNR